jgi:cytoskeletal protein CcmA (bactofilin family)
VALVLPATAGATAANGDTDAAIVVISGDVTVAPNQIVDGVFIASGDARIAGQVDGDVVVLSGDVVVSGRIDGDLFTASGTARLLPSAEVTGDVGYGDERPLVSDDARVHGDVEKQGGPDLSGALPLIGGFLFWLAITLSLLVLGALLLLVAPRAADSLASRSRERIGPAIAIGITMLIALPVLAFVVAITILGLPLALLIGLSLLPLGAVAYLASAYALGRRILPPSRGRMLAFLVGLAILRVAALIPILGLLVGLAALVFGLGLIGAAIGAAREPSSLDPARTLDS